MPFVAHNDNTLLIVAQLQIIFTFIGGFLLASRPFALDESLLGWALLLFDLGVIMVAIWMQYKHGSTAVQIELQLMEHEFRDAEMALTLAEMRSDVDKLVTKLSVKEATEAAEAGESVALLGGGDATSSRTHADMMLMKVTGKITIG